jgi:sigma-B regulation protein RsbU (phosphoserine phosphatase)
MGVTEDSTYRTEKIVLNSGDTFILYTDGVTEAMDYDKTMYSANRLITTVDISRTPSLEQLVSDIIKSVKDFTGEELQSDDITILAVRFIGGA